MSRLGAVRDFLAGNDASYVARLEDEPDYRKVSAADYDDLERLKQDIIDAIEQGDKVWVKAEETYGKHHGEEATARNAVSEVRNEYKVGAIESLKSIFGKYEERLRAGNQVKLVNGDSNGAELRKIEKSN